MDVLRTIPMDGTFDQPAPLERLKGISHFYSFDLKAATDLLPVVLTEKLLAGLVGQPMARSWYRMMAAICFRSPDRTGRPELPDHYLFTRGQPLGYYSSWPLFTLTHHALVWLAAEECFPGKVFRDYAILGDDIVIGHTKVAQAYARLMDRCQAVISLEKSIASSRGAMEFAKRFIIRNHRSDRMDLSPLSLPLIRSLSGFVSPYVFPKLGSSFLNSFRLRGGGYRVYSRIRDPLDAKVFERLSRRWKRHWLSMFTPGGLHPLPADLWLTLPHGGVLDCYQYGMVRSFIFDAVQPKDFKTESFDRVRLYWEEESEFLLEQALRL
ncbi:hypothetical protein AQUCO_02300083v1 [Aquilegia coerulea]|uniref:Reverse transcriptase domain-containing protein n=1 Tax=Aquilegia coerulea TaxID=218851 RepID=A0A2G5DC50_AQUCA|nr:hypothetical protein AQUCO_02300083v1 [Aquilegia coerulea]